MTSFHLHGGVNFYDHEKGSLGASRFPGIQENSIFLSWHSRSSQKVSLSKSCVIAFLKLDAPENPYSGDHSNLQAEIVSLVEDRNDERDFGYHYRRKSSHDVVPNYKCSLQLEKRIPSETSLPEERISRVLENARTHNMLCNSSETASPTANTESRVVDSEIIMDEKGAYSPFCSPDHPSLHYETHIYFPFSNAIPELSSVDDLIRFFKEWRRKNDPLFAIKAHFHACYLGLDTHRELGNHLVPMFVDCGCLSEGQKVFNKLTFQNEHSWTSLIQGCIRQGDCQYAFNLFRLMEQSQVVASSHTFVALLQACAAERLVEIGWELHAEIIKRGHDTDLFVGNVLLDMYFKCFFLEEAHKVFDVLPSHDVVSWNTLISGYVGHGHNEEALRCLEDMQEQGLYCNDLTFIVGLKAATNIGAFDKGLAIHAEIARECHEYSFNLGSTLVDMYAKCGALLEAKDTFNDIVDQDAISWNPLITTYGEHGLEVEALECLKDMKIRGFVPDVVGLIGCMKACGKVGAIRNGHELHAECTKRGIERGAHVGSALIDMYGNLGAIDESEKVFSALTIQSVVTWTALIASYADSGFAEEALHSLEQMQIHSMVPNDITLVCCLKACGSILTIERGREIHMEIVKLGFEKDSLVGSSLVDMYGKCCTLSEANKSFSMLPERGVVAWTALISGYIDSGFNEEALCAFKQMQCEYVMPNIVTFICGLKACGNLTSLSTGLELHKCIIVQGLESEPLVSAALVDMYVNCGSVSDAFRVFEELPAQDVATWNALMAGCIDNGLYEEAIYHFSQMQLEGICPNSITFVLLLKAYGILQAVQRGEELFIRITKQGLDEDPYVGNTLIDFFSKCDRLADAQKVLSNLPIHNVVSWTSLISGYVEHGYYEEAMEYASIMKSEGILPDGGTFICCLKACCHMGAIDRGYETHMELIMESFDNDVLVENTLVDMYAKNACLEEARDVFYEMQVQDVVGWTSLIGGYALYMDGHQTLEIFQQMQLAGAAPDAMTWNNVILGFAEEGESFRAYTLYGQMLEQGLLPNMVTSTNVLKACGSIAALQIGRRIAASAYGQAGLVQVETALENAIMDMYGRCGSMADAQKLFDLMPSRELITWNGLITGYARQGQSDIVFSLMLKMKDEGFQPNQESDRVSERAQTEALEAQYNHKSRTPIIQNDEALEQNTGVSSPEDEDKKEEAPQEKSDVISSEPELDIVSEKEKLSKKSSKKPKAENDSKQIKSKDLDISTSSTESAASKSEESVEPKTNTQEKSDLMIETRETSDAWDTQADESKKEKVQLEKKKKKKKADEPPLEEASADEEAASASKKGETNMNPIKKKKEIDWALCEFDGAIDFIPCLDNVNAIKALPSTKHYEHRERHCPDPAPTCLVPLPDGYRRPVRWPKSRNEVWYANVPHPGLISYKKDQNWVKKSNDKLIFPGGGTQFKQGALHYIDYIQESFPKISWGKRTRVILDVGCGVASFGGYIFDRDVLTMSFAPKDEHEAQVQLALERGIPAISSVMGTQRLVFPSNVYDAVHCARCRVPWHIEGGKLLLELNRVLRPGGYFIWSATPVYWTNDEDVQIWKEMVKLTRSICWKLVEKFFDDSTGIGAAVFQKPRSNQCYENRNKDFPPMCDEDDKPDSAWYVPMSACIHRIPNEEDHGGKWPQEWPLRLTEAPAWLSSHKGVYDKTAASDFVADTDRWQRAVQKSYLGGLGIEWKDVRNVMDMRASFGGFAAALSSLPVWVMNVVPSDAPDTLPIIFDRGLFGIYHDWCESFSSYPRTYDLLHADHLFGKIKKSCDIKSVVTEVDRLLRPGGWLIARDKNEIISELQDYFESLRWNVKTTFTKGTEGLVAVEKSNWRPETTF